MSDQDRTDAEREAARRARDAARVKRQGGRSTPTPPPAATPPRQAPTPPPAATPPRQAPTPPPPATPPRQAPTPPPAIPAPTPAATPPSPKARRTVDIGATRSGFSGAEPPKLSVGGASGGRGLLRVRNVLLLSLLVLVVVVAWFAVSLFQPFSSGAGTGTVNVVIPADSSTSEVASLLAKDKVVSSSFFFKLRVGLSGDHFEAGTYELATGMPYGSALAALEKGPAGPPTTNVTIIPGKSRYQLTQLLKSQGVAGDYSLQTRKSPLLNPITYGAPKHTPSLEGFLYPDTYQVRKPLSISTLVADQLTQFKKEMATVNLTYARSRNLTAYDVLIIASLEDAEAAKPSDLPKVASVIYNRLAQNMTLGLDTTVAYAVNNYSGNLTNRQLHSSSPWNTTNHHGLPPTPIDSPDITALQAAAHPAKTDDLYFIVRVCGNGSLAFTNSFSKFEQLSRQYNRAVAARGVNKTEFCAKGG